MIGERSADFAEHNLVPSLKLIDFGRTQESEQEFERMVYDLWLVCVIDITYYYLALDQVKHWRSISHIFSCPLSLPPNTGK